MSGNEVESHISVTIAAMESAKLQLLPLFDRCYPHMFTDVERREWKTAIIQARERIRQAQFELETLMKAPVLNS